MQTVMVVDEDPLIRQTLGYLLQKEGLLMLETASPAEGLQMMRTRKIDLVITEVEFAAETCRDFPAQLQQAARAVPIIVLSASAELTWQALIPLAKPVDVNRLRTAMRTLLDDAPAPST